MTVSGDQGRKAAGKSCAAFPCPRLICGAGLCAAVGQGQLGPLVAGHPSVGNEALNSLGRGSSHI